MRQAVVAAVAVVVGLPLRFGRVALCLRNDLNPSSCRCWTASVSASTLGLFVHQHLLEPLPPALVSRRVATQAGGYQVVVEAAVRSTMVVAAPLRLQWQTLPAKRILPQALMAVLAVLDVLTVRSRRLGVQPPHLFSPLELLLQAAAHVVARDPPAFLVLCCAPAFFCLPLVLVGLVVETLVLHVDMVPVAVMATVLLLALLLAVLLPLAVVVLLLLLLLPVAVGEVLSVAVLLRQELRLPLVAAEAVAVAPLGSGEM